MTEPYVFLIYSRKDKEFVDGLTAALRDAGVRTWTDKEISAGANWRREIEKGLDEASALVYVSSKHSAQSVSMSHELQFFSRKTKPIIPLIIDDEGAENLPLALREYIWVDFRSKFDDALSRLVWGITGVQPELQSGAPVATPAAKSKGYVFISYAAEDTDFVAELKAFLSGKGYAYWDFRESTRDYQRDYSLELEEVIKNAKATLSVISPDWKRSQTSLQELHFSREIETPVFLLKAREPGPTLATSGLTYIDFTREHDQGFAKLEQEMRRTGL